MTKQLNISSFEGKLLHYFHEVFLTSNFDVSKAQQALWYNEIPRMWHESEWLRKCIFSTSTMFLGSLSDFQRIITETNQIEPLHENIFLIKANSLAGDISKFHIDTSPNGLFEITDEYFGDSLNHSNNLVSHLMSDGKIGSEFQAAETFITGVLIFSILMLRPKKMLPVVTFKKMKRT